MTTEAAKKPLQMRNIGKRTDMYRVDPQIIVIEKNHNGRDYRLAENRAHLDSLKISIKEIGVLSPLMCRMEGEQCILIDGECRLRATLEVIKEGTPIETVPVTMQKENDPAMRQIMMIAANNGKALSDWEVGASFKKLIRFGWSEEKIAAHLGYAEAYVKKALELSEAPDEIKQQLSEQAISPQLAIQVMRTHGGGAKAVEKLREAVAAKKATGKKGPAKAVKARSVSAFEDIARKMYKDCETEYLAMQVEGAEKYDYVNVRTGLIKKLAALCNGEKPSKKG